MTVEYLDLADYLAIAAEMMGLDLTMVAAGEIDEERTGEWLRQFLVPSTDT